MGLAPQMKAPPREMDDGVWRRRRDGFRVTVFVGEGVICAPVEAARL